MPTAQDIYDALIQNPDYQNIGNISREEVVKREALRRARQHANNEKALSMAVQNSALGKLSAFVQGDSLQKARAPFDEEFVRQIPHNQAIVNQIHEALKFFEGEDGWEVAVNEQGAEPREGEGIRIGDNNVHLSDVGRHLKQIRDILTPLFGLENFPDMGLSDLIDGDSREGQFLHERILGEDAKVKSAHENLLQRFNDHPQVQEWNQAVEEERGSDTGGGEEEEEDEEEEEEEEGGGEEEEEEEEEGGGGGEDEREDTPVNPELWLHLLNSQPQRLRNEIYNWVDEETDRRGAQLSVEDKLQNLKDTRNRYGLPTRTQTNRAFSGSTNYNQNWETQRHSGNDLDEAIELLPDGIRQQWDVYRRNNVGEDPDIDEMFDALTTFRGQQNMPDPDVMPDREDEDERDRGDDDRGDDDEEDEDRDTGGGGGTGETWTGSTERLPYGADFDVAAYSDYIPKQIDGDNPPALKPKDLEGNEFDPLEGVDSDATLREKLESLKELYHQFHAENDGETATLGRGAYFPQHPPTAERGVLKFKKDEFDPAQIKKYNELNSSKAVMEEYLKLMHGMTQGYIGSPWYDSQSFADGTVTGVWQDRPDVGSESHRFYPQDGAYEWHTILETLSNTDWEQGGEVRSGDAARDEDGNLNWHMIPNDYMTSWTYHNALQNRESFVGTVRRASGIADRDFTDDDWQEFAKRFVANNALRFPGLGSGVKFERAFAAWKDTGGEIKDTDAFIDWMEGQNASGNPNWHTFTGTRRRTRTGGGTGGAATGGAATGGAATTDSDDEGEDGAVLPRLDGAGIATTLDPEKRDAMINRLMATERRHGNFEGDDEQVHREYLERMSDGAVVKEHDKHVVEANRAARRKASENAAKDEGHLTHSRRQEMIRDYISSHKEMYNQTLDPRLVKILEEKSDKDLQQMHGKMMQDHGDHSRKAGESLRTYRANNIDFSIKSLAPLQEHLTKEDILMQARRLLHHQQSYGDIMDGDAKKVWKERMQEAHQLADAANMNLDMRLHEDMEKADEHGDFGSTAWLERVGEAHVGTQNRRHAHQEAVSRGGELRTNRNYKPHIVARYDDAGEFQGFHDLSWVMDGQPGGMPVDQHMLQFDEDNHYHFHGLDETKVKEYQKYLAMKKEERPSEIPPVFGPPPKPTHNELKELEEKVHGTDYKDVRDRFEEVGELSGAEESFYKKFNMRPTGRPGRPKNSDGSEADIPRFLKDANDSQGVQGWYHPESGSWINPHRYQELIDHMEGQSNAGRVVLNGQQFYGKGNTADPNYAFALPTEAKSKQFRSGYGDQSYYIDGTGAIAHAQDSYDAGHIQDHIQPQSVNGVIHDWYAQQIGNQMKANPKVFRNEEGKARQVAVVDSPPQTPMGEESPFQNMWLALAAGESLGREPGSALARRDKKKSSGWEWFDRKLGQHGGSDIKEGIARAIHPMSATARDPLSSQELGQEQWWTNTQEAKQKYFDVINYPRSGLLSWVGKLLIGGEKPEDKVIRRIRQGYQQQAMTEKLTREAADKITVNGKRLSESYVAPGEQSARTEDYDELKRFFTHQKNVHTNLRNVAQSEKNEENAKEATNQLNKYTQHSETLAQLDSKAPNHWERINALYDDHLGKVNQAPTAADSLQDMGSRLQQHKQQQQLGQWAGEMNQPTEKDPITLPEVQVNHPDIPRIFGAGKQAEIPSVFV